MARGVKGGDPDGVAPVMPMASSTFSRTASSVMPSESSALAATPSPSWIRPSRMCSVPMKLWLSWRASSCARTSTRRARSVNRSNTYEPPVIGLYVECNGAVRQFNVVRVGTVPARAPRVVAVDPLATLAMPTVEDDLGRFEPLLFESVVIGDSYLDSVTTHLIGQAASAFVRSLRSPRPLAGSAEASQDVLLGGVALELVHLASLYHDDVMDEATIRRNVESVNSRFGNLVAIVAGDYLMARSAAIAADLGTEIAGLLAARSRLATARCPRSAPRST